MHLLGVEIFLALASITLVEFGLAALSVHFNPGIDLRKDIDIQIGERVRVLRLIKSVEITTAATACNLSPGDYEASEDGQRRFRASELYTLTQVLGVSVGMFYNSLSLE